MVAPSVSTKPLSAVPEVEVVSAAADVVAVVIVEAAVVAMVVVEEGTAVAVAAMVSYTDQLSHQDLTLQ